MRRRLGVVTAGLMALAVAACGEAEAVDVQELPPLQRPSPEARAGIPEIRGVWRFAGFEIPARDTTLVRERVYALTPPGDFQIATQRLDSVAGRYVRGPVSFPFTGEVRRDSVVSLVAFSGGVGQFLAGRVVKDTLWVELTSFTSAVESWPRGTRAALVRRVGGPAFRRLIGGAPINAPVDSTRLDSIRVDSLRRAGVLPPAGAQPVPGQPQAMPPMTQPGMPPAGQPQRPPVVTQPRPQAPVQQQPRPQPPVQQRPPAQQPRPRPPAQQPRPQPPVQRPPTPQPTPPEVSPPPQEQPPFVPPRSNAPRDTIRFGEPPR